MARRDRTTADLFAVPRPAAPVPGSMDYRAAVCGLVAAMLHECEDSRFAIAARCSELTGREVSKYMLDSYCAESRDDYNAPAHLLPVIEAATGSYAYSNWLAEVRGGRLMVGRDALAAELGRVSRLKDELAQQERGLKEQLRRGK